MPTCPPGSQCSRETWSLLTGFGLAARPAESSAVSSERLACPKPYRYPAPRPRTHAHVPHREVHHRRGRTPHSTSASGTALHKLRDAAPALPFRRGQSGARSLRIPLLSVLEVRTENGLSLGRAHGDKPVPTAPVHSRCICPSRLPFYARQTGCLLRWPAPAFPLEVPSQRNSFSRARRSHVSLITENFCCGIYNDSARS